MIEYTKNKAGILVPKDKEVGVRCSMCPEMIWSHNEAGGRVHLVKGKPVCARCRIMKLGNPLMIKQIRSDKAKYLKDLDEKDKYQQAKADEQVRLVASQSIKQTKTALKRKK